MRKRKSDIRKDRTDSVKSMKRIRRRTERTLLLLVFLFCALFMRPCHAEEIEGSYPYQTSGNFGEPEQAEYTYTYRDSFFTCSSYELNMDLARMSLRLAFSGFGYGESSDASNLLPLFDRLGIRYDESSVHYGIPGPDSIGYAYGVREISEDSVLVVVVVRGGNYKQEWAGNFTLGNGDEHKGFLSGAEIIEKELSAYLNEFSCDKKVSVLLTGYSRGAAVCNLAAAEFDRLAVEGKLGPVKPESLYTYCFACPLVTRKTEEGAKELYANIFSFVNPADLVPKVAPGEWGYGRYGTTFLLPTALHDEDYETYEEVFLESLRQYSKAEDAAVDPGNIIMLDRALVIVSDLLGSPSFYARIAQDTIRSVILGDNSMTSSIADYLLPSVSEYLDGLGGDKDKKGSGTASLTATHAPEYYLAALDALTDGTRLQKVRQAYRYVSYDGKAGITVYDSNGNAVVAGDGKKCTELAEIRTAGSAYGLKGEFLFDYADGGCYYVVVTAEKRMKVTFRAGLFDSLASRDAKRTDFESVLLKKNEYAILVLTADAPVLYRGNTGTAAELLDALIKGEEHKAEQVKADKVIDGSVKDTPDTPIATEPTPTPTPAPTATPAPSPEPTAPGQNTGENDDAADGKGPGNGAVKTVVFVIIAVFAILIAASVFLMIRRKKRKSSGNGDFTVNS